MREGYADYDHARQTNIIEHYARVRGGVGCGGGYLKPGVRAGSCPSPQQPLGPRWKPTLLLCIDRYRRKDPDVIPLMNDHKLLSCFTGDKNVTPLQDSRTTVINVFTICVLNRSFFILSAIDVHQRCIIGQKHQTNCLYLQVRRFWKIFV